MTYNDSFQVTEHGLLYVIHKVELFTEDGFIASLYVRNYSESARVSMYCSPRILVAI